MSVTSIDSVLLEKSRNPVPGLHVDDRFMLAFVQNPFMNDLADIDRAAEQMVDCAPREYSAAELPTRDRSPDLAPDPSILEPVVEDCHILRIYI